MTNETARREIEFLDYYLQNHTNDYSEESHTAMMMAIKALEQQSYECTEHPCLGKLCRYYKQPCEDAISRQAAIDTVVFECGEWTGLAKEISKQLRQLPPVTPTNEDIKEAYLKGYDYGVKDWFKSKTQPTEVINKIPEDYVYDTETNEFEVYRHKYTGKEIHIIKEPKLYKLEAQPTDTDCISREQALLALTGMDLPTDGDKLIALFTKRIQNLPPVTPERSKGKWIEYEIDIAPHPLHCSICGFSNHHISNRYIREFRRCPNCGAEMEVEENGI